MPKQVVLKQYRESLTPTQAAEGIQAAIKNAKSLVSDAELLLENQRWSRAVAIAILAIEESGKPSWLRSLLLARDEKELREEWKNYRSHIKKNLIWLSTLLAADGATQLDEFSSIFADDSDHGQTMDALKQIAIYSDAYENCHWSLPGEVVDEGLAKSIVKIAHLIAASDAGAMTTAPELELWVKHMKPVWKDETAEMKRALLACYAEAHSLGVLQGNVTPNDMVKFVL